MNKRLQNELFFLSSDLIEPHYEEKVLEFINTNRHTIILSLNLHTFHCS